MNIMSDMKDLMRDCQMLVINHEMYFFQMVKFVFSYLNMMFVFPFINVMLVLSVINMMFLFASSTATHVCLHTLTS